MTMWPLKQSGPPYTKPESCKSCLLYGNGVGFGFPTIAEGGGNGVGVVLEAPGADEEKAGEFLVGSAGYKFDEILKRAGVPREDFTFIENVLHCRPPNSKLAGERYEQAAIHSCAHFLDDTIQVRQPKVIFAMGGIPLKRVADINGNISRNRGFVFDSPTGIPVIGSFHPNFLLPKRGEEASGKFTWVVIQDLKKAIRIAKGERRLFPQRYLLDPGFDLANQFMREYENGPEWWKLAWDLETEYKKNNKDEQELKLEDKQKVLRVSFAFRQGYAMTVPWTREYLDKVIIPLFRMNRPKVGWNSHGFDEPVVLFQEQLELNGILLDGMDQFKLLQPNLNRNLEFVTSLMSEHLKPWKHLSQAEPEWYSAEDSDATITDVYAMDEIMRGIEVPSYD